MKKIILFIASAIIVSFALGQQTITPDIQKLIQEKLKKDQDKKLQELNPLLKKADRSIITLPNTLPLAKLSQTLADGSKAYILPLDNMPCVEPDLSKYDNMPNLAIQKKHQLRLPDNSIITDGLGRTPNADILKKIFRRQDIK